MNEFAKCPFCNYDIELKVNSQKGSGIDLWLKEPEWNTKYNLLVKRFFWYLMDKEIGDKPEHKFEYNKDEKTFSFFLTYYKGEWKRSWKGKFKLYLGRHIEVTESEDQPI